MFVVDLIGPYLAPDAGLNIEVGLTLSFFMTDALEFDRRMPLGLLDGVSSSWLPTGDIGMIGAS